MADEKKPKIDLKTRLQKMGNPAAAGSAPAAIPVPGKSVPPPPAIPMPMGVPSPFASQPPPRLDPSNPLAAVAVPFQNKMPTAAPSAPAQPQRIEVDEAAVHQARKGTRNVMLVVALLVGGVGLGVGWLAGGSLARASAYTDAQNDAKSLAKDLTTARGSLQKLADSVVAGQKSLTAGKFPDTLEKDLSATSVDFDGKKLAGKKLAGISDVTMKSLIDFIVGVQALEKKKASLREQLITQKQPITDYLAAAAVKDKTTFKFVITVDHDALINGARVLPLAAPLVLGNNDNLPPTLKMPTSGGKTADVDRFVGAEIKDKPFAMLLASGAETAICGGDAKSVVSQLNKDMQSYINDIRAESSADATGEQKIGLAERADELITALSHIGT